MRYTEIKSCYIGPEISPEQFIAEHFFLYLAKGTIEGYDGISKYHLKEGECCIVRKNHLARYNKQKQNGEFEKVVVILDTQFLEKFAIKHKIIAQNNTNEASFVHIRKSDLVPNFILSLMPYYNDGGEIDDTFSNIKREELLLILIKENPELTDILFDFAPPEKIDLKAYMNRNYKFNISMERFAYLTGRSISGFKRDFAAIFSDTPSHWLIQRRLQEGYFLIEKKGKKPSDIYLDLGFEDLSHFSFAFKKKYGITPSTLLPQ
ncbi:AraC-like DNA-binding protein [Flavobacterium araucananum]|jgi:AraC-like DNA-binding protein|uniref:AraC family transcriptional regulator n=1 Tax=Flavobacterium araucananum TaxID=946678 RepID=A0A227P4G8_9FLAO|nr:AraC family transcriptional regulator [Flavobacterium araucananum]OXG04118.1 AraC family transcriptional regulator [Flavobacterium araucananum]PWK01219.1 AraC-like DNA-binding protein [Flavobacterium araucananum]